MELVLRRSSFALEIVFGSLFIALCSFIFIPTLPVHTTMQTFALFILAFTLGPEKAFFATALYLAEATVGLPVLCGRFDPTWFTGPSAGYLLAFPFATYLIGRMSEKYSSYVSIACGQLVIFTVGFAWLAQFIGYSSAFVYGVLFFLPAALVKNIAASAIIKKIHN